MSDAGIPGALAAALNRQLAVTLRQIATEVARTLTRRGLTPSGTLRLGETSAHDGVLPQPSGGTGTARGAEPPLGVPATDGRVLASTVAGVRSWVPQTAGTTLATLADVALSDLREGDALTYRAGKWRNTRAANIGLPGNVLTTGPERLTVGGADLTIGG